MDTIAISLSVIALLVAFAAAAVVAESKRATREDPIRASSGAADRIRSVLDISRMVVSGDITSDAALAAMLAAGYSERIADLVTIAFVPEMAPSGEAVATDVKDSDR